VGQQPEPLLAEQLLPVRLIQRRRQRKYNLNDVRHVADTVNGLSTLTLCSDHSAISRVQRGVQLARRENTLSVASSAEVKNPKMLTAFLHASDGAVRAAVASRNILPLKYEQVHIKELVHDRGKIAEEKWKLRHGRTSWLVRCSRVDT
jgi:hypothetical protein